MPASTANRGTWVTHDARGQRQVALPSLDLIRTRTDFLPPDLAASIASTTSAGRLTDLPATSRIITLLQALVRRRAVRVAQRRRRPVRAQGQPGCSADLRCRRFRVSAFAVVSRHRSSVRRWSSAAVADERELGLQQAKRCSGGRIMRSATVSPSTAGDAPLRLLPRREILAPRPPSAPRSLRPRSSAGSAVTLWI